MPSTCIFELNKPSPIYFSGETITGTAILNTTSSKNVRDVSIIFLGESKVKWTVTHSTRNSDGTTSSTTTYYKSHEIHVNNRTCVHGDGVLEPGTYTYTFSIALPWQCPTSFEGKFGHTRYEISMKINRYYRFDNVFNKPISVIKTEDLNLNPAYSYPLQIDDISSSCCWPCSNSQIYYALEIPFRAYAPGQTIRFSLNIANQSSNDCEGYDSKLVQQIIFTVTSPRKAERRSENTLVSKYYSDHCLRLSNRILLGELTIPPTPPTTDRASIICIQYVLIVTVIVSGCRSNMKLKVPIVIGTIPLRRSLAECQTPREERQQTSVLTAPEMSQQSNLPPNYSEIAPPTFEEATCSGSSFIDIDVSEKNRIVNFRPLYPMYNSPKDNTIHEK